MRGDLHQENGFPSMPGQGPPSEIAPQTILGPKFSARFKKIAFWPYGKRAGGLATVQAHRVYRLASLARIASTDAQETTVRRAPIFRPCSLPESIQRRIVERDLPRIRAASRAGISGPGATVAASGGLSQAVRMASRWAGESPASASRIAATAARVWGLIREGFFVFMRLLFPKGKEIASLNAT